jgi:hypothetical protein
MRTAYARGDHRAGKLRLSVDLPPDPFLPDDPRLRDDPIFKYIREGKELTLAFVNSPTLSTLVQTLQRADRRDVELAALFGLIIQVHAVVMEVSEADGLTDEEANARWVRWLVGPPSDGTLDDL